MERLVSNLHYVIIVQCKFHSSLALGRLSGPTDGSTPDQMVIKEKCVPMAKDIESAESSESAESAESSQLPDLQLKAITRLRFDVIQNSPSSGM